MHLGILARWLFVHLNRIDQLIAGVKERPPPSLPMSRKILLDEFDERLKQRPGYFGVG